MMMTRNKRKLSRFVFSRRAVLLLGVAFFAACAPSSGIPARPEGLGLEIPEFEIPKPERWTLSNGLEVYYYYNPELPLMRASLYIDAGSLFSSFEVPGLAAATGSQMREGGIEGYSPEQLDSYLDRMAASIESNIGDEYGTISLFCLSEDFDELFPVFGKVVKEPAFKPERLSLWKALALDAIRRRPDNPAKIASMVFTDLVYGRSSPFAEYTTPAAVAKINPNLLHAYHDAYVVPQTSRLAISGSLSKEVVARAVEAVFGEWEASDGRPAVEPRLAATATPGIYVVQRPLDQSTIIIGHEGPPRHTPEDYALRVFSEIFGSSGFSTILFQEIRTERGLAYSVYGGIWPGLVAGVYQVGLQTRNEQAISAVREVIRLSQEVREEQPDSVMFEEAQDSVERSFVFKFDRPEAVVDRAVLLDTLGYPEDYDERYLERIEAVGRPDVREVAAEWIAPEKLYVVVVGGVSPQAFQEAFPAIPVFAAEFDTAPGAYRSLKGGGQ